VVGFIDDDLSLQHKRLDGLRVLGDHRHLEILAGLYQVQELFLALPEVSRVRLERVEGLCRTLNIALLRFVPRTVHEIVVPQPEAEPPGTPAYFPV
jgi:FlaA1/EpsC-like NDP-sugar epimerase